MEYLTEESLNIAQISHEIRNPLTLINCTLCLLDGRYPHLKDDELWTQLHDDVDYLKKLTVMLSDYKSCSDIYVNQINIEQLLFDIIRAHRPLAQTQHKSLTLSIRQPLEPIMCDAIKIRQALTNLIKNAIEATSHSGTIEVEAHNTKQRMYISIRDNGCGISPDKATTIFQPFVTNKTGGTGLGLAITRKIITLHGGTIRVYSKEGIGTKFVISLPMIQTQTQHPQT